MTAFNNIRTYILVLFTCSVAGIATTVVADDEVRTSTSVQYSKSDRDNGVPGRVVDETYGQLNITGNRASAKQSGVVSEALRSGGAAPANADFWFYSADVILFNDHDQDGHFHGIDLLFDADTYYASAEVYAVVYLSLDGGPWNEYSATDNFTLFDASADDEFNIVTELVSGYPTGSYDLLIELFDGFDNRFLASYGPIDTPELAFLPLEDANRDAPFLPPPNTVIVRDHGGAIAWPSLLALLLGVGLLRKLREKRV